jgi:hypothetical protein
MSKVCLNGKAGMIGFFPINSQFGKACRQGIPMLNQWVVGSW